MPMATLAAPTRGCGHTAHTSPAPTSATSAAAPADNTKGIEAPGNDPNHPAAAHAAPATLTASEITIRPTHGTAAEQTSPHIPSTNTSDTRGPHTAFATGAITESTPKVGTATGTVAACATTLSANGPASFPPTRPSPHASHASPSRANTMRPATAHTDSWNPISNPAVGLATNAHVTASASALSASERRPPDCASAVTTHIDHARTADGWIPVSSTYPPVSASVTASVTPLPAPTARDAAATSIPTTTRCAPLTATRCESPAARTSRSSAVPASRVLSPSVTPERSGVPDPSHCAITS